MITLGYHQLPEYTGIDKRFYPKLTVHMALDRIPIIHVEFFDGKETITTALPFNTSFKFYREYIEGSDYDTDELQSIFYGAALIKEIQGE